MRRWIVPSRRLLKVAIVVLVGIANYHYNYDQDWMAADSLNVQVPQNDAPLVNHPTVQTDAAHSSSTLSQYNTTDPNWHWGLKKSFWPIKVPRPIIDVTLPKSGTSSVYHYFNCRKNEQALHTFAAGKPLGKCIYENNQHGRPSLEGCGFLGVFSDLGTAGSSKNDTCYYPQIDGLEEFYKWYPQATLLLVTRNSTAWYNSIATYAEGSILIKWIYWCRNQISSLPQRYRRQRQGIDQGFVDFYDQHTQRVRNFAEQHPSMTYVELNMDDPNVGRRLESEVGIPAACWKQCKPPGKDRGPEYVRGCRVLPGMEAETEALEKQILVRPR